MKKKMTIHMWLIGGISILLTTLLAMLVFYNMFQKEVFGSLRTYADFVDSVLISEKAEFLGIDRVDGIRVTIIEADGTVSYDNNADMAVMDKHDTRPEIKKALETGEGTAVRRSLTIGSNNYYYAMKLSNGMILRVSKEAGSIAKIFYNSIPVIVICGLILFITCLMFARYLTARIIKPIEEMAEHVGDGSNMVKTTPYEELVPFATTIKNQHDSIVKQLKELEQADQIRQEFTANVSHELKTPLTSISGYAELIEQGMATGEDAKAFASKIGQNSARLLTMINDIIQLSELDHVNDVFEKETLDLYEIARECVSRLSVNAKQHEVYISLEGKCALIEANHNMMEELITNLCDNAIRYNVPYGCVNITVAPVNEPLPSVPDSLKEAPVLTFPPESDFTLSGKVILTVQDTGIGIPEKHISRIFERFYRVDKSRSKATGGTGLGLSIVKHILASHNAPIQVRTLPSCGTIFTILFEPAAITEDSE
ncbi:MAG: two-component sensor histidine kinase [Lachnospiraceae bacterium]|nr:two-component sensor histidine kinase [Lachnospiraceae bacterium]